VTQAINEFDPEIRETLQANLARFEGLSRDTLESRIRSIRTPARKLVDDDPEKLYEFIVMALLLRDKAAFQTPEYLKYTSILSIIVRVLKDHGLATDRAPGQSRSGIEQIHALPEPVRPQLEASWRQHESKSYEELQAVNDALADKLRNDYGLNKAMRKTSERMVRHTIAVDVLKFEAGRKLLLERVAVMLLIRFKTPASANVSFKTTINNALVAIKQWVEEGAVTADADVVYWMPDFPERFKPEFLEIQRQLAGKTPAELGAMVEPLEAELKGTGKLINSKAIVDEGQKSDATEEAREQRRRLLKLTVLKARLVRVGTADEKRVYRAWVIRIRKLVLL
jgi:hypothetical protein